MSPRRALASAALLALALLALAKPARAQLMQPDGTPIPCTSCPNPLQSYFDMRSENINAVTEAAIEPERFVPGCAINFTVVVRDTGYLDTFGWYNIQQGRAPTASELFQLVGPNDPVGYTASLNVRTDSRYTGGEIGFYLQNQPGDVFYSERAYQPDATQTGGRIHVLIYNSHVTPQAFYFAWEDLFGGGDNDFQDLLIIVDNLVCSGGGTPCTTGTPGVCSAGISQCRAGGMTCVPLSPPSDEVCDGLDNNCNGATDEGNPCTGGDVCDQGRCRHPCGSGEFPCPQGLECNASNACVEPDCLNVPCTAGQVCRAGQCVEPCSNVVCPHGEVCRVGRCVDPCDGLTCDPDSVCVNGVCVAKCACAGCATGSTCGADGRCVTDACSLVTCAAGTYCDNGACMDACQGAACPVGQVCQVGQCVQAPPGSDAGTSSDAGNAGDAGVRDAGSMRDAGNTTDAGGAMDAGGDAGGVGDGGGAHDSGSGGGTHAGSCGCRAAGSPGGGRGEFVVMGALAIVAAGARRRRRRG